MCSSDLPLRDYLPPKPPFQCPHQTKKGTILLLFELCIHLHIHQDLKRQCRRVTGQETRYGRPTPHDSPGTHNWLAQLHIASFFSEFHAGTILEVWSELLLHCLDSPRGLHRSACASDFWKYPQHPPFYPICSKGGQQLSLS